MKNIFNPVNACLIRVLIPPLPDAYLYELPEELCDQVSVGLQVLVPFGARKAQGYVTEVGIRREDLGPLNFQLKTIPASSLLHPIFLPGQLELFRWIARYYGNSLSQVIDCAVPPFVPKVEKDVYQFLRLPTADEKLGSRQQEILAFLQECKNGQADGRELRRRFPGFSQSARGLLTQDLIKKYKEEKVTEPLCATQAPEWAKRKVTFNDHQELAVQAVLPTIQEGKFASYLLHGITGSGKTEVYIALIEEALRLGRGALILVPEIALTPQLHDRFQARLGNNIAMLHSGLSKRHRWEFWRGLLERRYRVALGARSAVFAPIPDLGLIIIDEEHDASFKQNEGIRYHGRDLAVVRAQYESVPIVLGSATPSLETWENVQKGRYTCIQLPARYGGAQSAPVEVVDLREIKPWEMTSPHVSPLLFSALLEILERKEQAFLLYNRRGFASYLYCNQCGESLSCPHCSVTLTYHKHRHRLVCHYCGHEQHPPKPPHDCHPDSSRQKEKKEDHDEPAFCEAGAGTERIVEEVSRLFPLARIARLDRDSARTTGELSRILQDVRAHEIDILIGTQMIAKGHDMPNVTLVGIVDADVGLHVPDFRASERAFQLIMQVAGRAGRSTKAGRVILQTRVPGHAAILHACANNFENFAQGELQGRKSWAYPPYQKLLRILVSAEDPGLANEQLRKYRSALHVWIQERSKNSLAHTLQILGPAPAPLERIKGLTRAHLLCKAHTSKELQAAAHLLKSVRPISKNLRIVFDHDPQDML